jgi:hypothetical protein
MNKWFKVEYKFVYRGVHVNELRWVEAMDKQHAYTLTKWELKESMVSRTTE